MSFGTINGIGKEGAVKGERGERPKNDCVEVHKKKGTVLSVERLHEFKQTFFPLTATDFSDTSTAERQTSESKIKEIW